MLWVQALKTEGRPLKPEDRSDIVKLLIENGADVNTKDNSGMTALAYAF